MSMTARQKRSKSESIPPAKRAKFQEIADDANNTQTNAGERKGRLHDWFTWIKHFASAPHSLMSRLFHGSETAGSNGSPAQEAKTKSWKVRTAPQTESPVLTRPPLHIEGSRWKSLKHPQSFSSGNPFMNAVVKTTLYPKKRKELVPKAVAYVPFPEIQYVESSSSSSVQEVTRLKAAKQNRRKNWGKKSMHTAMQTVRLEEKEQYKLLLSQHTKAYEGYTLELPTFQSKAMQTDKTTPIFDPLTSAFSRESLSAESKKNMTKWLKLGSSFKPEKNAVEMSTSWAFPTSGPIPEVIDSDVEITRIELPSRSGRRTDPLQVRESPFFSPEWIQDLKKTINIDSKDNLRKIQEQERKAKLMQEQREARVASENQKLIARVRQLAILPESPEASDEEEDSSQYPELTTEMESKIEDLLRPNPPDEILAEGFRLSVTRRDMETLAGLNWLNDEIINFYTNMLMERGKQDNYPSVYAFNTFFYPKLISSGHSALKRWTRKIDIFSYRFILIPVHLGMHWCLAVVDFSQKKIQYYDSMGGQNNDCLNALSVYLREESLDKKKTDFNMNDWKTEPVKNIPHQMNGSDCGMFALKYAEYITRNSKITFTQAHMPYFRRRMVYEIFTKQLM